MIKSKCIYHYCTVGAFLSIIQNKCIRLSDLNKTNDYMEKRWSSKYIEIILKDQLNEYKLSFDLNDRYIYKENSSTYLDYYNNEMNKILFDNRPILSTCFSEEKDKLSQWRAYGQDGEGLSIGFNYNLIKELKSSKKNMLVEKVIYDEEKQKKRLSELIKSSLTYEMKKVNLNNTSEDKSEFLKKNFNLFCASFINKLENISCVIKNPAFSEEKEIRIIYDPQLYNPDKYKNINLKDITKYFHDEKNIGRYKISQIKFNMKKNQIVAFCNIDFSNLIFEGIINEIIIGPKCKITRNDIYYFLLSNGYDINKIEIDKSNATYR